MKPALAGRQLLMMLLPLRDTFRTVCPTTFYHTHTHTQAMHGHQIHASNRTRTRNARNEIRISQHTIRYATIEDLHWKKLAGKLPV